MAKKLFTNYKFSNWDQVKKGFADLSALAGVGNFEDGNLNNLWYALGNMVAVINDPASPPGYLEKSCLSLVQVELADNLKDKLGKLAGAVAGMGPKPALAAAIPAEIMARLNTLDLDKKTVEKWQNLYSSYDQLKRTEMERDLSAIADTLEVLKGQVLVCAAVVSAAVGEYTPDGALAFLQGKKMDYALANLIRTLRDCMTGEKDAHDITMAAIQFLEKGVDLDPQEMEWPDVLVLTLLLGFLYGRFPVLGERQQGFLLTYYLHHAVVFEIPAKNILQDELRGALGVMQYMTLNKSYLDLVENSQEKVITDPAGPAAKNLGDILKQYLAEAKDDLGKAEAQDRFAVSLFPAAVAGRAYCILWMKQILEIYSGLKQANLIDWMSGRVPSEAEQYEIDMLNLFTSFGMNGEFDTIADYYKNKTPLVPLGAFLNKLKDFVDIGDEKNVESLLRLNDILHANNLLEGGKELIIFDQDKNKFTIAI